MPLTPICFALQLESAGLYIAYEFPKRNQSGYISFWLLVTACAFENPTL